MDGFGGLHPHDPRGLTAGNPTTGQNYPVTLKKFVLDVPSPDEADAFVFVDLDDATTASGVVRSAKKILVDGARSLARSETYSWALIGLPHSGASAGINAPDHVREAAVAAFDDAVAAQMGDLDLQLRPAKGVATASDPRHDLLLAHGVVAATASALGDLDGRSVTLEAGSPAEDMVSQLLEQRGASVERVALDEVTASRTDALVCGSRIGIIDHETAALLEHRAVVPSGPSPLTARAFAVMRSRERTVVAGFLSACGPLFAQGSPDTVGATASPTGDDSDDTELTAAIEEFIARRCDEFAGHPDGPFMAACYEAERFLGTWRDELPFGRPLG